eukprot:SAG31_NODE_59_length_29571_cov_20.443506_12_plen_206_part_00
MCLSQIVPPHRCGQRNAARSARRAVRFAAVFDGRVWLGEQLGARARLLRAKVSRGEQLVAPIVALVVRSAGFLGRFQCLLSSSANTRKELLEKIRRPVEFCDSLQSFLLLHSMGGGTGSGLGEGCYFLVFCATIREYGTFIERNKALIEKVSPCRDISPGTSCRQLSGDHPRIHIFMRPRVHGIFSELDAGPGRLPLCIGCFPIG